jgi:hypothetical protein
MNTHYHRITAFFAVITLTLITGCLPVKEQQSTTAANTQNSVPSSLAVPSINYENIKNGVELVRKGYEFGGMAQLKEVIVDCHGKLKASNDRQLLELCTVIEITSSNLNHDFVKKSGIAGTALDDQFFSFDSMGSRVEPAWIRAGFIDETQRKNIIEVLTDKTEVYYNQSFSTQTQGQSPATLNPVYTELMSLIESGKHTAGEYHSYLRKHDFDQGADEKLPGFSVFSKGIFLEEDEENLDDVITLYFDHHHKLVAIFSFSIGSKLPLSKKFVEKSQVENGQIVFLVKNHPMRKKIERFTKEWVSVMN